MTEVPPGPESLFPPPPETLSEPPFLEKRLRGFNPKMFLDNEGRLNVEGRRFGQELFGDLYKHSNGDLVRIKDEIKDVETELGEYKRIFQSLKGKLNFEIGLTAAHVLSKEKHEGSLRTLNRKHLRTTFIEAMSAKKEFKSFYKDEDYLEALTNMDKKIRSVVRDENIVVERRLEDMITRYEYKPKKFSLRPQLGSRKAWLAVGMGVVIGTLIAGGYIARPGGFMGPTETSVVANTQTIEMIVDVIGATGASVGQVTESAVGIETPKIEVSGTPTLYSKGTWEKVIENRIGKKNPLNPELAKNPQVLSMVKDKKVAAVNPAILEKEYEETIKKEVSEMKSKGMNDTKIASELGKDKKLRELARKVLGKVVDVELPDGRHETLLVMDVFQAEHAASAMGLIKDSKVPHDFVADFHPDWFKKEVGMTWESTKGWQDLKGARVEPPQVRLSSLS